MSNDIKSVIQTPKEKLISKIKESAYHFNKEDFKKFQDFFSGNFSNANLEKVRKQAWRKK